MAQLGWSFLLMAHLFFFSVEDELGADSGDQAVDEACDLSPGNNLGVDKLAM